MVLGAGVGTRLEPITNFIPKPLVPIANRPVIDHIITLLRSHGFNQLICNVHYLADQMKQHLSARQDVDIKVHYEEQLSGDAGGVRACREFLQDETFVVIMGDLLTDADLSKVLAEHKRKKAVASIAIKGVHDVSRFGVVVTDANGFIVDFQEKPSRHEARSDDISTGIYILEPEVFKHMPSSGVYGFGRQLFPLLVRRGYPVAGIELSGFWTDIGTLSDYLRANCDAASGAVHIPIDGEKTEIGWVAPGAHVADSCKVEGQVILAANCIVGRSVRLIGNVIIGAGAVIGENSVLEDCVVFPNAQIAAHSRLTSSVVAYERVISCGTAATSA